MSRQESYHPQNVFKDPHHFYKEQFEHITKRWIIPVAGRTAMQLAKPTITYINSETEADYFGQLDTDISLITTFSHRGKQKYHDPLAAVSAVFSSQHLLSYGKEGNIRVWAAVPYMIHPAMGRIVERFGGVAVYRTGDYQKEFGIEPNNNEVYGVTNALIEHSTEFLESPRRLLAIFPAGTKGGQGVRDGVGHVMADMSDVAVIPIALVSDSESLETFAGNRPKNLRVVFGEPILSAAGMGSPEYVQAIDSNLTMAAKSVGG